MVLKDFKCEYCTTIQESPAKIDERTQELFCDHCGESTKHKSLCNGGTGVRYRFCDFSEDPRDYRGQVKASPPLATVDGEASKNKHTGLAMHDDPRFSEDSQNEKRDKIQHETDRERGYNTIYF